MGKPNEPRPNPRRTDAAIALPLFSHIGHGSIVKSRMPSQASPFSSLREKKLQYSGNIALETSIKVNETIIEPDQRIIDLISDSLKFSRKGNISPI